MLKPWIHTNPWEMSCCVLVRSRMGSNEDDFHGQLLLIPVKVRKWSAPRALWYKTVDWLPEVEKKFPSDQYIAQCGGVYTFLWSNWCWLLARARAVMQRISCILKLYAWDCQEKQRGKDCVCNPLHPVSVLMSKLVEKNSTEVVFVDSHSTEHLPEGVVLGHLCWTEVYTLFWLTLCKTDFELEGDVLKQLISVW